MLLRRRFCVLQLGFLCGCTPLLLAQAPAPPKPVVAPGAMPEMQMIALTTSSPAAKDHFMMGLRALDLEQAPAARTHFAAAIAADPSFALAHLYTATSALSLADYKAHLDHAAQHAAAVTPAERLLITIEQRAFANDLSGRLETAQQLVAAAPSNPRALQELAAAHLALDQTSNARTALAKAVQLAPRFAAVHVALGNSYLTAEPRDLAQAEAHIRHGLDLEPNVTYTHDYMGDLYRAKNELQKARVEYTRMSELDPTLALAFQQRGHVNAFLGNFAEARADYDRAIALADPAGKAGFGVFRALVNVYAGDPAAAERELDALVAAIDGMSVPNPVGVKINALNDQFLIAAHHKHFDVAGRAVERLEKLWQQQAEIAGTPTMRGIAKSAPAFAAGMLAARKGDFATARAKAREYMQAREAENNPRKNEGAHAVLAMADLLEGKHESAVAHFAEVGPNDIYMAYHRALALSGAGRQAEARELFKRVAETNFSSAGLALTKKDAAARLK